MDWKFIKKIRIQKGNKEITYIGIKIEEKTHLVSKYKNRKVKK